MVFAIHWHESAMDLHVFPIPFPPPTSLSTWSLWVFPVHQARALVSYIQPGLVICFTLDNIHVSMLFSRNIPLPPSPTESKSLFCTSVSLFLFCTRSKNKTWDPEQVDWRIQEMHSLECPQFLTEDHWKMPLLLALHPDVVLTLQHVRVMSNNYSQSSWSRVTCLYIRNIAKVVPTQILPLFPPLSENQSFRWRIISFLLQRPVDPLFSQISFSTEKKKGRVTHHIHY